MSEYPVYVLFAVACVACFRAIRLVKVVNELKQMLYDAIDDSAKKQEEIKVLNGKVDLLSRGKNG